MKSVEPSARLFTSAEILGVVLVVGVLVAVAIIGSEKARSESQDKAVLSNMRKLVAASNQYFRNYNTTTVALASLVGPAAYIKALNTVANESYPLVLKKGEPVVVSGIGGSRSLSLSTWVR